MPRRIISEKPLTWAEALEILEKRRKEVEAGIIVTQERTWDYLKRFSILDPEIARNLVNELVEETGISEEIAVVIANLCPTEKGLVRAVLEMDKEKKYSEDLVSKIVSIAQKHCLSATGKE